VQRDPAARRYAQAAFELAHEKGQLDAWERDLASLAEALALPQAQAFVGSRQVTPEQKSAFVQRVAGEISPLVWNLVRLLASKDRLGLLPQVNDAFRELLDEHRGIAHAQVVAAVELSDDEREAITRRLSEMTGKQVQIEVSQDPELLGGVVARIGDRLIDGSTRTKLVALKRKLAGAAR
jgi:F-type H+-transporting ATPase subunit delta